MCNYPIGPKDQNLGITFNGSAYNGSKYNDVLNVYILKLVSFCFLNFYNYFMFGQP